MKDLETKSLWSHLLGKSMRGDLKDAQLKSIPSLLTDFETWARLHEDTTIMTMPPTDSRFTRGYYNNLEKYVVGMSNDAMAKAWAYPDLKSNPLLNDKFGEEPVVILFDAVSATPVIFDRTVEEQVLTFVRDGETYTDKESQSTWDLERGIATDGELKGKELVRRAAVPSFKVAWETFYPKSEYWSATE